MSTQKTSSFLAAESYVPDDHIIIGKHFGERVHYVGRCYEASPLVGGGDQLEVFVSSVFKQAPDESVLQVNLIVGPDHDTSLIYRRNKDHGGDMVQELVRQRAVMADKACQPDGILTGMVRTNRKRLIISYAIPTATITRESIRTFTNLHKAFHEALKTAGFVDARPISPNELIGVYRQLADIYAPFRPTEALDPGIELRRQVFTAADHIDFKGESHCSFNDTKCTAIVPKEYPEYTRLGIANLLIGSPFNQGTPRDGGGGQRLVLPHIVSATVRIANQGKEKKRIARAIKSREENTIRLPAQLALGEESGKILDDLYYMKEQVGKGGDKYTKGSLSYFLFSKQGDEARLKRDTSTIINILDNHGFDARLALHNVGVRWAQSLPLNYSSKVAEELDNEVDMPSSAASALLPVYGNWRGNANPDRSGSLFWSERGEPFFLDVFKTNGDMNGNIAAKMGMGKGVLVNQMIIDALAAGQFVAMLDNGNTYRKTCDVVDGEYISFDPEHNDISLNPFSGLTASTFEEEYTRIAELLLKMTNFSEKPTDAERTAMQDAVKAAWGGGDGRKADEVNLSTVEKALNSIAKEISDYSVKHGPSETENAARNLAGRLRSFSQDARRSSFFRGASNLKAKKQFVVIELGSLDGDPHLKEVVLFYVMNKILSWVNRDNGKKLIFVDECWELLKKESAADVIESLYRKARKEGGGIWTITQDPEDGCDTRSGQVINKFSNWKLVLGLGEATANKLIDKRFYGSRSDDPYFCRLLRECRTEKGKYSEILVMNEDGYEKVRHYLNPFMLMVYNTEQEEREQVFAMMNSGSSAIEAVETVANDFTVSRRLWLQRQIRHMIEQDGYSWEELQNELNSVLDRS